jgi:hypothetical protein
MRQILKKNVVAYAACAFRRVPVAKFLIAEPRKSNAKGTHPRNFCLLLHRQPLFRSSRKKNMRQLASPQGGIIENGDAIEAPTGYCREKGSHFLLFTLCVF